MYLWEYIGNNGDCIKTLSGMTIASTFERIVHGGRGAYVEFAPKYIQVLQMRVPEDQKWRLDSKVAYYIEHRTVDSTNAKIYQQLRTVDYADYKIGMFYISPTKLLNFQLTGKRYRMAEV